MTRRQISSGPLTLRCSPFRRCLSIRGDKSSGPFIKIAENSAVSSLLSSTQGGARMRSTAAVLVLIGLVTVPLGAQGRSGRYDDRAQGIPPGHLPPPGECRVWYDDRPAGHQPPPSNCRQAERVASRDRYARVIYGGGDRQGGRWERDDDRAARSRPRAIPRRDPSGYPYPGRNPSGSPYPYPERYPNERGGYGYGSVPFDTGYRDGHEKGREDARDSDAYDPVRHSRYRSGDHGYDRRYGSKEEYKNVYREGFRAGYDEAYRDTNVYGPDRRRSGIPLPRPF